MTIAEEPFDSPDARKLRELHSEDLAQRYGGDLEPGKKPTAEDTTAFLVARDDAGRAVGCGALRALDAGAVELKRMYVHPEVRRTGLGRALLAALEQAAAARGFTRVRLETGTAQHEAMSLYESAGYRRVPCWGAYAVSPISICYERELPG